MTITNWPKLERPRERLMEKGAAALSDAELLAILMRNGVKGKDAVSLSRELLARFIIGDNRYFSFQEQRLLI